MQRYLSHCTNRVYCPRFSSPPQYLHHSLVLAVAVALDTVDEAAVADSGAANGSGAEAGGLGDDVLVLDGGPNDPVPTRVYSFGRGDLSALLQNDDEDHSAWEGPVELKSHWNVLQVSTSLFHTMAVTATGDVLGCGQNDEGQVGILTHSGVESWHCTVPCCSTCYLCSMVQCSMVWCSNTLWYSIVQWSMVWYCSWWYNAV
ncbi:unnamed protein product [Choristocarpus tenellus]